MATPKSLTPAEADRLRDALRELNKRYEKQKELADAVGVSQQMISLVLGGGKCGVAMAIRVAKLLGYHSYVDLVGDQPVPLYRNSGNWPKLEDKFRAMYTNFPPAALMLAGETPAYLSKTKYDLEDIAAVVNWVWRMSSDDVIAQAVTRHTKQSVGTNPPIVNDTDPRHKKSVEASGRKKQ